MSCPNATLGTFGAGVPAPTRTLGYIGRMRDESGIGRCVHLVDGHQIPPPEPRGAGGISYIAE